MVSVSVRCLFYQPMDEKIKTWTLCFPAKESLNIGEAFVRLANLCQYDAKVQSAECLLNQPKATRVCICSINQSNRSISGRLLFLFCSRVFISRSYENRSIIISRLLTKLLLSQDRRTYSSPRGDDNRHLKTRVSTSSCVSCASSGHLYMI